MGPFSGQNWGAEKLDRILLALKTSFSVSVLNCLAVIGLVWWVGEPLAEMFSDDDEITREAVSYMKMVSFSLWGYGLVIISASAFNGIGKSDIGFAFYFVRMFVFYVPLSLVAGWLAESETVYLAIAVSNCLAGATCAVVAVWWLRRKIFSKS